MTMKKIVIIASLLLGAGLLLESGASQSSTRDLSYEAYCDSIWAADPDYYLDVLMETDEYHNYLEVNGQWWEN